MPKIQTWDNLPLGVRQHLIERMRGRSITLEDLNQLRLWVESKPEVPDGDDVFAAWARGEGVVDLMARGVSAGDL